MKGICSVAAVAVLACGLFSCSKEPGEGGLASVSGKVFIIDLDKKGEVQTQGYGGDERVFIGVKGESGYFEDTRTDYNGAFRFPYLRKGEYNVWVFSRCDTCLLEDTVMLQSLEITDRKQEATLPDFTIYR